jgi:hypothetical protein
MALNMSEEDHQFVVRLNDLNCYLLCFLNSTPRTLGEINMEPISFQRMDPNRKLLHARAYIVLISVKQ